MINLQNYIFIYLFNASKQTKVQKINREYFWQLKETIVVKKSFLLQDSGTGLIYKAVCIQILQGGCLPSRLVLKSTYIRQTSRISSSWLKKYQILKYLEYLCHQGKYITQTDHLISNHFSSPTFSEIHKYMFQQALIDRLLISKTRMLQLYS